MTSKTSEISFKLRNSSDESENTVFQYLRRLKDNVKHLFGKFFFKFLVFVKTTSRNVDAYDRGYVELSSDF